MAAVCTSPSERPGARYGVMAWVARSCAAVDADTTQGRQSRSNAKITSAVKLFLSGAELLAIVCIISKIEFLKEGNFLLHRFCKLFAREICYKGWNEYSFY